MEYHTKLAEIDEEKIQEEYEEYKELRKDIRDINNKLKLNESKTKSLKRHRDDLDKFEYDKDCEYCIKMVESKLVNKMILELECIH